MNDITVEYVCPMCVLCGVQEHVGITDAEYDAWDNGRGMHVQDAFPDRGADFREMILTGTHFVCWDKMFGDDE